MAKAPDRPNKDPAKRGAAAQTGIKPTRAKAHRPAHPPMEPALADLLNPAIRAGTAGIGSGTGLQPPPDNSFERRADFAAAHTARKSTAKGFGEAPQAGYVGRIPVPPVELDPDLAKALGITDEEEPPPYPPPQAGEGKIKAQGGGEK